MQSFVAVCLSLAFAWQGIFVSYARADLFDTARNAMRIQSGQVDATGVSIRGGARLETGQNATTVTLARFTGSVGGTCGSFDFGASLREAFDQLPEMFEGLLGAVISELPMLVLCYASPTLCDIAKHWQALVNLTLQARFQQCHQIQAAMAYGGLRLRGGQTSQCLEEQVNNGATINEAMRECNGSVGSIRSPLGDQRGQVELVGETLQASGASTETQVLANQLLGTLTLNNQGGRLGASHNRSPGAMLQRYETHQGTARAALDVALDELQQTGQVSEATLRQISVPGQPMPKVALEALLALRADASRFDSMAGKLTTGLAITKLRWECSELQEQLAAAIDNNTNLTDEQRRILEGRLKAVEREMKSILAKKETVEQHLQPAMQALVQEYYAVQQVAVDAWRSAGSTQQQRTPYRGQVPLGYGQ